MINRRGALYGVGAAFGCIGLPNIAQAGPAQAGSYVGTLVAGMVTLRLQLILTADNQARLISLDQGSAVIPASDVKVNGNRVAMTFSSVGANYVANLSGSALQGTFSQNGQSFPLRMSRGLPKTLRTSEPSDMQSLSAAKLSEYRAKSGTPALGVAWQGKDARTHILVDGKRRITDSEKVSDQDQWHIGSCTKSMTATLMARAVEAGLISWTTRVDEVFSLDLKTIHAGYHKVSLLALLSHHSGMPKDMSPVELNSFLREGVANPLAERRRFAVRALSMPALAPVGSKMIYSNNGYIVAAAMLEKVTGKSWEELIARFVFNPLGLSSAGFGPPGNSQMNDQPAGHILGRAAERIPIYLDNPIAFGPAGRVHINLMDWMIFLRAHCDRSLQFLSAESWNKLHRPPYSGQSALGWFVGSNGTLWHNGSNTAWYAEAMVDQSAGCLAAFVSNDAGHMRATPGTVLQSAMRSARSGAVNFVQ